MYQAKQHVTCLSIILNHHKTSKPHKSPNMDSRLRGNDGEVFLFLGYNSTYHCTIKEMQKNYKIR